MQPGRSRSQHFPFQQNGQEETSNRNPFLNVSRRLRQSGVRRRKFEDKKTKGRRSRYLYSEDNIGLTESASIIGEINQFPALYIANQYSTYLGMFTTVRMFMRHYLDSKATMKSQNLGCRCSGIRLGFLVCVISRLAAKNAL